MKEGCSSETVEVIDIYLEIFSKSLSFRVSAFWVFLALVQFSTGFVVPSDKSLLLLEYIYAFLL